jgi:hypothetical protein
MTALNGHESAGEIEREAEIVRARLAETLDQLRDNLTPQHLTDEVLGHAKDGASALLETLGATAAKHPVPALLVGAGCAALIAAITRIGRASAESYVPVAVPYQPSEPEPRAMDPATARRWAALGEHPIATSVLGMIVGRLVAAALPRGF